MRKRLGLVSLLALAVGQAAAAQEIEGGRVSAEPSAAAGARLGTATLPPVTTDIVADTAPDRTLGTTVTQAGRVHLIDGGTLSGTNLFHSFARFDLARGDIARWVHSAGDPAAIGNVISRVTGGDPSRIFGTIDSTAIASADFWFINPAGIVFGATAQLNVPAAAHFSTASELRFSDGAAFAVATPGGSTLSVAAPEAFGFVGGEAGISVEGVGRGFAEDVGALSLTAADIRIEGAALAGDTLLLTAVGEGAATADVGGGHEPAGGSIAISNSFVDASLGAGLAAGSVELSGSTIRSSTAGDTDAGPIRIAAQSLALSDGSAILSESAAGSTGNSGQVEIQASEVRLAGASSISTDSGGAGAAGFIQINTGTLEVVEDSTISTNARGSGDAGLVGIAATDIVLDSGGSITSRSAASATGDAGLILIGAERLSISGGASIRSDTSGAGEGGGILIQAREVDIFDGGRIGSDSLAGCTQDGCAPAGPAGAIGIFADRLRIGSDGDRRNPGEPTGISSDSRGQGGAGAILLQVRELVMEGPVFVTSDAFSFGQGGSIEIVADSFQALGGALVSAQTFGFGAGGSIAIRAGTMEVGSEALIEAGSGSPQGQPDQPLGDGGSIEIVAGSLLLHNRGQIRTSTFGGGDAGTVSIAADRVTVDSFALISSDTFGTGEGGGVLIAASELLLNDGGQITSQSLGTCGGEDCGVGGGAGDIAIDAGSVVIRSSAAGESGIFSDTFTDGRAGRISLTADTLRLDGEFFEDFQAGRALISSETNGGGDAGEIFLDVGSLDMDWGYIQSRAVAGSTGNAGSIAIRADTLAASDGSSIRTETEGEGAGGPIAITAGTMSLDTGAHVSSSALSDGLGDGGGVTIEAGLLNMQRGAYIASLTAAGGKAGTIRIRADELRMQSGAQITSSAILGLADIEGDEFPTGPIGGSAGDIDIVAGSIFLSGDEGDAEFLYGAPQITSDSIFLAGNAGNIRLQAESIELLAGSLVASESFGLADAGTVTILGGTVLLDDAHVGTSAHIGRFEDDPFFPLPANAGRVEISGSKVAVLNGSTVGSLTNGDGDAGTILISGDSVEIAGLARVETTAGAGSTGNAGRIDINAGEFVLDDAAAVSSTSEGTGEAGRIRVEADSILIDRLAGITSNAGLEAAAAGTIELNAGTVTVDNGAFLSSSTFGAGAGGGIRIEAGTFTAAGFSTILSNTAGSGRGGAVVIEAQRIDLKEGAEIASRTEEGSTGNAGSVELIADWLGVQGGAIVSSETFAEGNAGSVAIRAAEMVVADGGVISSSTAGAGNAGSVAIEAGILTMDFGRISSGSAEGATGGSGAILIAADRMEVLNRSSVETISRNDRPAGGIGIASRSLLVDGIGSRISSSNENAESGDAGLVAIAADFLTISNGGEVSTSSAAGAAGDIRITMPDHGILRLEGASAPGVITTSSGPGTGGRIIIASPFAIVVHGGNILALGEAGGANVLISTNYFIPSADRVNAVRVDGELQFENPIYDVSAGTVDRDLSVLDASRVLRGQCPAARQSGQLSEFTYRPTGPYAPRPISAAPAEGPDIADAGSLLADRCL